MYSKGVSVDGYTKPTISGVAYDYDKVSILTIIGTEFVKDVSVTNDVDATQFIITGEGETYSLPMTGINVASPGTSIA